MTAMIISNFSQDQPVSLENGFPTWEAITFRTRADMEHGSCRYPHLKIVPNSDRKTGVYGMIDNRYLIVIFYNLARKYINL
jgi:hypothetical protein